MVVRGRSWSRAPSVSPAKKKGKERAVELQVEGKIDGVNDCKPWKYIMVMMYLHSDCC